MFEVFAQDPKELNAAIHDDEGNVLIPKVVLEVLDTSPPVLQ
jgi:hypothetical protein